MRIPPSKRNAGFTLVEVIIGATLSLLVMGAVLSSYVFLAKNFTRSLGISSPNQPTLESQGRRALAYFSQDVRMAGGIVGTPSSSEVTFTIPTDTSSKTVTYFFNNTAADDTAHGAIIKANTLTRIDNATGAAITLHANLLQFPDPPRFDYYDNSGNPYAGFTNYLSGITQISMTFSAQAGIKENGTLTPIYSIASQRLILRNKQLLP